MNKLSDIYEQWKNNTGLCRTCPCNDENNYWYPLYGIGNEKADIAIIADTPAYNLEGIEFRWCKNYDEKIDLSNISFDEFRKNRLDERVSSSTNMLNIFVEEAFADTDIGFSDIYFTNVAKCSGFNTCKGREKAYTLCRNYLYEELMLLGATKFVTVGAAPYKAICELFWFDMPTSILKKHCNVEYKDTYTLMPFYHWGYARRKGKLKEYYKEVNDTIKKEIIRG